MSRNLRLQLIMDAAGNATRFLKGLRGDTDATSKALRAARERVTELQRASKDVAAYRQMTDKLGQTRDSLKAARGEAARLAQAHSAAAKPTRQLSRAFEQARDRVRILKASEEAHSRTLQDIRGRLDRAGLSTKNLSGAEAKLARDTRQANEALDLQRTKLKALEDRQNRMKAARSSYDNTQQFAATAAGAGASSIAAGAAAAAPLIAASGAAITFQDAMLDVKKVVDFDTPQQFQQMNRDVLQLSKDLGLPAEGVAQIIAAAGQAKIAREELKGFATDAGQMGVAFGTTAEDAGEKMATWRTAFAMTQDEVRAFADQVNYLGDNGNATALAIAGVVTRVGPLAGVAGAAAAEVAALGSTIVGMGVAEEVAATGIKNTMLALTKGEAATKAQRQAYAALGLEAEAVAKAMQMDAGGTIVDVLERVRKLTPDRQASILTQLFGSESVAAIAPMLSQLDVLKTNFNAVADSQKTSGSMAVEFANRMSGAKGAIDQASQGLKGVAITAGSSFLPMIRDGALAVSAITGHLTAFANAHPNIIKVVGVLTGVIAAGLIVFGGLALAVSAVLGPFALLRFSLAMAGPMFAPVIAGALGAAKAFAAWGVTMLANPITWIVLGIVAAVALLAGGVYLIYKNWGRISAFFSRLWDGVAGAVAGGVSKVMGFIMKWTPLGAIARNWSALTDFFGALWELVGQTVGLGLDYLKLAILRFTPLGLIMRNWQPITGFLTNLWSGIQVGVARGIDLVRTLFLNFTPLGLVIKNWSGITGYVGSVWTSARSAVSSGIQAIRNAIAGFQPLNDFKAAFSQVWTWLQQLPSRLLQAGADAMRGFSQGIRGQRAQVQAAAADAAGRAETGARRRLDTHSPSRVFAAIGGDVMDGFTQGIRGGAGGVVARMRSAAGAIAAAGAISVAPPAFAEAVPGQSPPPAAARSGEARSPSGEAVLHVDPPTFDLPAFDPPAAPAIDYAALARNIPAAPNAIVTAPVFDPASFTPPATPAFDYAALPRAVTAGTPTPLAASAAMEGPTAPAFDLSAIMRMAEAVADMTSVPQGPDAPSPIRMPIAFDSGPALPPRQPPAPASPEAQRPSIGSLTLHVHAAPGQDAQEIAREVLRLLEQPNLSTFDDDAEGLD